MDDTNQLIVVYMAVAHWLLSMMTWFVEIESDMLMHLSGKLVMVQLRSEIG
jgi:hypothetical protein